MAADSSGVKETNLRSVVKTLMWRGLATMATMTLVYLFYRDVTKALEIGALEVVIKLFLYYGHERLWNRISWGRKTAAVVFEQ